jgi:hypothetical protein
VVKGDIIISNWDVELIHIFCVPPQFVKLVFFSGLLFDMGRHKPKFQKNHHLKKVEKMKKTAVRPRGDCPQTSDAPTNGDKLHGIQHKAIKA